MFEQQQQRSGTEIVKYQPASASQSAPDASATISGQLEQQGFKTELCHLRVEFSYLCRTIFLWSLGAKRTARSFQKICSQSSNQPSVEYDLARNIGGLYHFSGGNIQPFAGGELVIIRAMCEKRAVLLVAFESAVVPT